jgi:hypothetical protein
VVEQYIFYIYSVEMYILSYSMEQSPSQEIPHILWNPKVRYRTHKCPPPLLIPSQLHPVPTTPSHFLKVEMYIKMKNGVCVAS